HTYYVKGKSGFENNKVMGHASMMKDIQSQPKSQAQHKRKNWIVLFLSCFALLGLLVVRDLLDYSIHKFVFVALCTFVFIILPLEDMVAFLCMLFPLSCGLPGTYIYLIAYVILVIKRRGKLNAWQFIVPIAIILQEIFLCFWYPELEIANLVHYGSCLLILFFFVLDYPYKYEYKKALFLFSIGTCFMLIVILLVTLRDFTIENFLTGYARLGYVGEITGIDKEAMRLSNNSNNLAYYALVSIASLLVLLKAKMNILWKIISLPMIAICALIGIMTVSRAFALGLAIIIGYYIISNLKVKKENLLVLMVVFIGLIGAYYFLQQHPEVIKSFTKRFTSTKVAKNTIDDARVEIIKDYWLFMNEKMFRFTFGIGTMPTEYMTGFIKALHNGTEQIFVSYGVVGFVYIICSLFTPVLVQLRRRSLSFCFFTPLIAVVFFVQTIQFLNPFELMMPYIIGVFALQLNQFKAKTK
ncbi:MAG TPA: hypothetical protein DCY75_05625, partial [Clostridiales bacterium]|nr:hypothetical protein [Clostridiales bacterium]